MVILFSGAHGSAILSGPHLLVNVLGQLAWRFALVQPILTVLVVDLFHTAIQSRSQSLKRLLLPFSPSPERFIDGQFSVLDYMRPWMIWQRASLQVEIGGHLTRSKVFFVFWPNTLMEKLGLGFPPHGYNSTRSHGLHILGWDWISGVRNQCTLSHQSLSSALINDRSFVASTTKSRAAYSMGKCTQVLLSRCTLCCQWKTGLHTVAKLA